MTSKGGEDARVGELQRRLEEALAERAAQVQYVLDEQAKAIADVRALAEADKDRAILEVREEAQRSLAESETWLASAKEAADAATALARAAAAKERDAAVAGAHEEAAVVVEAAEQAASILEVALEESRAEAQDAVQEEAVQRERADRLEEEFLAARTDADAALEDATAALVAERDQAIEELEAALEAQQFGVVAAPAAKGDDATQTDASLAMPTAASSAQTVADTAGGGTDLRVAELEAELKDVIRSKAAVEAELENAIDSMAELKATPDFGGAATAINTQAVTPRCTRGRVASPSASLSATVSHSPALNASTLAAQLDAERARALADVTNVRETLESAAETANREAKKAAGEAQALRAQLQVAANERQRLADELAASVAARAVAVVQAAETARAASEVAAEGRIAELAAALERTEHAMAEALAGEAAAAERLEAAEAESEAVFAAEREGLEGEVARLRDEAHAATAAVIALERERDALAAARDARRLEADAAKGQNLVANAKGGADADAYTGGGIAVAAEAVAQSIDSLGEWLGGAEQSADAATSPIARALSGCGLSGGGMAALSESCTELHASLSPSRPAQPVVTAVAGTAMTPVTEAVTLAAGTAMTPIVPAAQAQAAVQASVEAAHASAATSPAVCVGESRVSRADATTSPLAAALARASGNASGSEADAGARLEARVTLSPVAELVSSAALTTAADGAALARINRALRLRCARLERELAAEAQAREAIDRAFADVNGSDDELDDELAEGNDVATIAREPHDASEAEIEAMCAADVLHTNSLFENENSSAALTADSEVEELVGASGEVYGGGADAVIDEALGVASEAISEATQALHEVEKEPPTSARTPRSPTQDRLDTLRSVFESASWRGLEPNETLKAHRRPSAGWARCHGRAMARLAAAGERLSAWQPAGLGDAARYQSVAAAAAAAAVKARHGADERAARAERRCAELSGKLAAAEAQARRLAARAARSTAGAAAQGGRAAVAMHGARRLGERRAREAARAAMAAMLSDDDSD